MKNIFYLLLFWGTTAFSQNLPNINELSFDEYIGFVKKYHPLVKNAALEISQAQANLMMARGGFDPKIEIDYDKKEFKNTEYYSVLNSSFKIPTWYGIELKAGFENNDGYYLNPQNTTPNNGLSAVGISVPLGQGLLINQRMADLQKAKLQIKLSQAEQKIAATNVLYDATIAYFNWKKTFDEFELYAAYTKNAQIRYDGVKLLIENGDKPEIDSTEAGITVKSRQIAMEDAKLKLNKSRLEVSNFLWLENSYPVELSDLVSPEKNKENLIERSLPINALTEEISSLDTHPKMESIQQKIALLGVDRKLKANNLLPKIDLGYSYLTPYTQLSAINNSNYKVGVDFYFPLFLRKERGSLKITEFKIEQSKFSLQLETQQLFNKISAQKIELQSLQKQQNLQEKLVSDFQKMLDAEERLFFMGESSLFIINSRENNLVSAQLAKIALQNRYFGSYAELFKVLANPN